jgi:hypothetical protein
MGEALRFTFADGRRYSAIASVDFQRYTTDRRVSGVRARL